MNCGARLRLGTLSKLMLTVWVRIRMRRPFGICNFKARVSLNELWELSKRKQPRKKVRRGMWKLGRSLRVSLLMLRFKGGLKILIKIGKWGCLGKLRLNFKRLKSHLWKGPTPQVLEIELTLRTSLLFLQLKLVIKSHTRSTITPRFTIYLRIWKTSLKPHFKIWLSILKSYRERLDLNLWLQTRLSTGSLRMP